jgi:hypothetical protein
VTDSATGHHRGGRARYALLLAVCQLSLSLSASAIMLASTPPGVATVAEDECSCEHSAATMCPMHRRSAPRPLPAGTPRWCGAGDDSIFALVPVYGTLAAPEPVHRVLAPSPTRRTFSRSADRPVGLESPPDNPPPRA